MEPATVGIIIVVLGVLLLVGFGLLINWRVTLVLLAFVAGGAVVTVAIVVMVQMIVTNMWPWTPGFWEAT